ncbi:thioredoxin family protein [Clostridium celatum]|nr:thioredoxin family protein [Clostridium celatum]MCE9655848.1 thioredoxin family protein [Clostridium celatum]MDU3724394.1 thioredoxin family protein [Clostridium celatum]MDY3358911.1 thioredoxin family protein [Clostridium celatum]
MLHNIDLMEYSEYLIKAKEEELQFINKLYNQGILLEDGKEIIKNIDDEKNVLVITATRCKDSATILPFLLKLAELNENIKIKFLLRKENRELLEQLSGELKVPTMMILDNNGQVIRKFIEFPKGVKEILISNSKEKSQEVIDEMRNGKYNSLIQEDLIKFLTGDEYEYISFNRLDN